MKRRLLPLIAFWFSAVALVAQSVQITGIQTDRSGSQQSPLPGQVIRATEGSTVTLTLNWNFPDDVAGGTQVILNGTATAATGPSGNSGTGTVSFPLGAANLFTTIQVQMTDAATNVAFSNTFAIQVVPPTLVRILTPVPGQIFDIAQTVRIVGTTNIDASLVQRVDFTVGGTVIGSDFDFPFSTEFTFTSAGTYDIAMELTEFDGTTTTSAVNSVIVRPPSGVTRFIEMANPTTNGNIFFPGDQITLRVNADIQGAAINGVEYLVNGQSVTGAGVPPYSATFTFTNVGLNVIQAVLIDSLGVRTTSSPVIVVVSNERDFVRTLFANLTGGVNLTPLVEQQYRDRISNGTLTPAGFIAELVQSNLSLAPRNQQKAHWVFRRAWLNPALETVDFEALQDLVRRATGFPDVATLPSDQSAKVIDEMFDAKYGVAPSDIQRQRLVFLFDMGPRQFMVQDFAADNETTTSNGVVTTRIQQLVNPPNNRIVAWGRTAHLMASLFAERPSNAEVQAAAGLSLVEQAERALSDPRFLGRRINVPVAGNANPFGQSTNIGGGWKTESFFGSFFDGSYPWVFHENHGWVFTENAGNNNFWFFFPDQGWMFASRSNPATYFFRSSDQSWLFYQSGTSSPRWFYNFRTSGWESR
jgi:hypothetical protein